MINLEVIQLLDASNPLDGFASRPFLNPCSLQLKLGRRTPRWLPLDTGCLYAGTSGELYAKDAVAPHSPIKVGDLGELVFGRNQLSRFSSGDHVGFTFTTPEAKVLAACLQDDTEIDLPAAKAQRLIEDGKRIYLSRKVITDALMEAVRIVGRNNALRSYTAGEDAWTMRRVFGTIS